MAAYKEAIRLDPQDAAAHCGLAIALRRNKDLDGAIAACEEAIRLDPKYALPHNVLGKCPARQEGPGWGHCRLRGRAIRLDPKNALAATTNLEATVLRDKKDLVGAIAAKKEAIRLKPDNDTRQDHLGIAMGE